MTDTASIHIMGLNADGLIAGLSAFAVIWGTRFACIWGEYHFRRAFRFVFLASGVLGIVVALMANNLLVSAIAAIFGFACLWGIHEVIEQEERVAKGWYPKKEPKKR